MPPTGGLDDAVEFAENPEPRCPCVLLLDTSGSMKGTKIEALNAGLETFHDALARDSIASRRVEVAIVTFDSDVRVVQGFVTASAFEPPRLTAQGQTRMGSGIAQALDLLDVRKKAYRSHGVAYYRPWLFLVTDGAPQGEPPSVVEAAAARVREAEQAKRASFFAVGVEGADMERLAQVCVRAPLRLKGLDFGGLFTWLSTSMTTVSHSRMDEQVSLPPPGWGTI